MLRGSIGKMPYQRQNEGLCALERMAEKRMWRMILTLLIALAAAVAFPQNQAVAQNGLAAVVFSLDMFNTPGQIPAILEILFSFLDCTAREVCRPGGPNAAQNAMWNGYHGHFIIWQGVSFLMD